MVRPVKFEYNYETAHDNAFQREPMNGLKESTQTNALLEFDGFVELLRNHKIGVTVGHDTLKPHTPDSIFPTNWVSSLPDGTICYFPLVAQNRRNERKASLLSVLKNSYKIHRTIDFTRFELEEKFLEGAGSVIVDYWNNVAYACLSGRTHKVLVDKFVAEIGIQNCVAFHGKDENGIPIYHTDVMMCIGDKYAMVCLDAVRIAEEKELLVRTLQDSGKEVIPFTMSQLRSFVGNIAQLENSEGEKFVIMSTQAFKSLNEWQRSKLESFNRILHSDLATIEEVGGGSAQCLMAKMYLEKNS